MSSLEPWRRNAGWTVHHYVRSVVWPLKYRTSSPLLARVACLGQDVLALLKPSQTVVNVQKGRIDYLMDCWRDPSLRARTRQAIPHVTRDAIVPCVMQEEILYDWLRPSRPTALFMDSMAELADQRFIHKRGRWSFLAVYGDTSGSDALREQFELAGTIPIPELLGLFRRFFAEIRRRHGDIPVFYLHFPTALETRPKYLDRAAAIMEAMTTVAAEVPGVHSIAVDPSIVAWAEDAPPNMADFPYHYNRATYLDFARRVRAVGQMAWGTDA